MDATPGSPDASRTVPDAGKGTGAPSPPKTTVGAIAVAVVFVAAVFLLLETTRGVERSVTVVLSLTLFPLALSARALGRNLRARRFRGLPRFTEKEASSFLTWQMTWALFLCLLWLKGDWTLETVRLRPEVAAPIGLLAGFALYLPLHFGAKAWVRWRSGEEQGRVDWIRAMRRLFPRTARGRRHVRLGLLFVPFVEEIAHRGILVILYAREMGHPLPGIALGLLVAVAGHAYQGRTQIPFHLAFAGTAIALAFSPLGLWGAIGLHVAGDLVPMLRFPRVFAELRAARAARGSGR
jgi:hypothetical protein